MSGRAFGTDRGRSLSPLALFLDDEGGYTTVAVALALLLSVTLVLFAGRVQWSLSRSAEVQEVADACSMAGANVVARYATCAQVCDALILSMGLAGLTTCAAALVMACIPGAGEAAAQMLDLGREMLDARSSFARSAVEGLSKLERVVPTLVCLNSIAVVKANGGEGISYAGVAVPFPLTGETDFSSLDVEIDTEQLEEDVQKLKDASERAEEARKRADEALMRGWMADCGNRPRCMRERASVLAGLGGSLNQDYPSPEGWTFGAALVRARNYYPVRRSVDEPEDGSLESLVDSCVRIAFYDYAINKLSTAYYFERQDGGVDISLPEFPHNTSEMRATSLYTDARWPCTWEEERLVLHATLSCPGAEGPFSTYASLADIDAGSVGRCDACQMDATDMGRVAAASTSIDNGFEHYWREIVLASRDYQRAMDEYAEAERELSDRAEDGAGSFESALEALAVPRPRILPPGAWGCVSIVARTESEVVPASLGSSLLDASSLPRGVAISAAMLAPDESTEGNSVLAHLFDGLSERHPDLFEVLGEAGRLWGGMIEAYGSAFDGLASRSSAFLERIDSLFGSSVGTWIKSRVGELVRAAGIEPSDIRMLKPVLVLSSEVFDRAGLGGVSRAQQVLLSIGPSPSVESVLIALGMGYLETLPERSITIGEIPIPGTDMTIPLEMDIGELAGAP